jgi:hypothetical protein
MILHCGMALCLCVGFSEPERLYVSTANQIWVLHDLNHDGDFLDFGEVSVYAEGLTSVPRGIACDASVLFVADSNSAVFKIIDLNSDGDALDFGEVSVYAQFPPGPPTALRGLAWHSSMGGLVTTESNSGSAYLLTDLNSDGDALDAGELLLVSTGLQSPLAVATRPDGMIIITQNTSSVPLRILSDRNNDGDFLDFAENLSYAENATPGADLFIKDIRTAFATIPAAGQIIKVQDLTGDDDAMDFAELVLYTGSLPSPHWITGLSDGVLFVACDDAAGSIFRVQDSNDDGDALDFGETVLVAQGLTGATGILAFATPIPECLLGDFNDDGSVNIIDVPQCVTALLAGAAELCRADLNGDGLINGRDIAPFVDLLLP